MSNTRKEIHLGLFSVSEREDVSLFKTEEYRNLVSVLKEKYGIHVHIPHDITQIIEGNFPQLRAEQIHNLYKDDTIDILWALTGGSAANEILEYLDYSLIEKHKKPLFGYSDVTILLNAIYEKTHYVNFLSPNLKSLTKNYSGTDDTLSDFIETLSISRNNTIKLKSGSEIYDSSIAKSVAIPGIEIVKAGKAQAVGIGGNLSSICLLVDTPYLPSLENKILLLEECDEFSIGIIRRNLFRLRHANGFAQLQGIIFGHINATCYKDYDYTLDTTLKDVFYDLDIPIIKNTLHGHILPMQTLPIGGEYTIDTSHSEYLARY